MSYALIFPGQGSQEVGMGRDLAERFPQARAVFDEADAAAGFSVSGLCWGGPEDALRRTENQQPAILTASIAAYRALCARVPFPPLGVAGHSLGEYSALVAAGVVGFADAVRTVRLRGRFMQEAVPEGSGAMAVVLGLDAESVARACAEAALGEVVQPANFNSPEQVVIAGHAGAVARAGERAKAAGAKRVMPLPVSAPFHCALMQPAAERLSEALSAGAFATARFPVVHNVTAEPASGGAVVRDLLVRQVTAPVRWEACVRALVGLGAKRLVEVGPGRVLAGLVKRIDRSIEVLACGDAAGVDAVAAALAGGAA